MGLKFGPIQDLRTLINNVERETSKNSSVQDSSDFDEGIAVPIPAKRMRKENRPLLDQESSNREEIDKYVQGRETHNATGNNRSFYHILATFTCIIEGELDVEEYIDVRSSVRAHDKRVDEQHTIEKALDSGIVSRIQRSALVREACNELVRIAPGKEYYPDAPYKILAAKSIIRAFPKEALPTNISKIPRVQYYEPKKGEGLIGFRSKTMRKQNLKAGERMRNVASKGSTTSESPKESNDCGQLLSEDVYQAKVSQLSLMRLQGNKAEIFKLMNETRPSRVKWVLSSGGDGPAYVTDILGKFNKFKFFKGELILLEFKNMFRNIDNGRLLDMFPSFYAPRIIHYCWKLPKIFLVKQERYAITNDNLMKSAIDKNAKGPVQPYMICATSGSDSIEQYFVKADNVEIKILLANYPIHCTLDISASSCIKMSEKKAPKPRAPSFTDEEIAISMTCLDQYKNIIENTKTDSCSMREKKEAWDNVTAEYEDMCIEHDIYTTRSTEQLKTCWKNVKAKVRKIDSEARTEAMMTGGGPPHCINPSDEALVTMVHKIKPTLDFTLENSWDSTAAFEETVDLTADNENIGENDSRQLNSIADEVIDLLDKKMYNDDDDQFKVHGNYASELECQASTSQNLENDACGENLLNERNEALAMKRGFCKPAASSYKNQKFPMCKFEKNESYKNVQSGSVAWPIGRSVTTSQLKRKNAKPKLTTSQKLGRQMRMWEVSLARGQNVEKGDDVQKTDSKPGILATRLRKCKENMGSDDDYDRPAKKSKLSWARAEQAEKIQRAEEARQQQAEFHQARMEVFSKEKMYWNIKIEVIELEKQLLVKQLASDIVAAYSKAKSSEESKP
ncbi:hypothetical protein QAD02_012817 [Eretmocerus hayati]|uniref:Uncharacterized protein n=1 Tax=Eretmocerus hayati TaxID=131215 RepID=A0ACC2P0R5_9HYME|nr:hypothetical protein QAD02_012817 [Eretmocerus hayati]